MIGRTGDGSLKAMYEVMHNGVRFCSICGERMKAGSRYSKRVIYDPIYRRETWMAQCTICVPVVDVPWNDLESRDTPVRVNTPLLQNTTGDMKPLRVERPDSGSWLNSPPPKREWRRETPAHIDQMLTQITPAVHRGQQTDPKLWRILREMVGK